MLSNHGPITAFTIAIAFVTWLVSTLWKTISPLVAVVIAAGIVMAILTASEVVRGYRAKRTHKNRANRA